MGQSRCFVMNSTLPDKHAKNHLLLLGNARFKRKTRWITAIGDFFLAEFKTSDKLSYLTVIANRKRKSYFGFISFNGIRATLNNGYIQRWSLGGNEKKVNFQKVILSSVCKLMCSHCHGGTRKFPIFLIIMKP